MSERSKSCSIFATFSNIYYKPTLFHLQPKILATKWRMDINQHGYCRSWTSTSPALSQPILFEGNCRKANIKINRKVGSKIKNPLGDICPSSVPSKYLFLCARRKLGFNKKIRRKLLIMYMY
jgi:hypothetical protein